MPPTAVPQDHKRKASTSKKDKYAPTVWGSGDDGLEDLEVPSGQVCLVRRPGVQRLMEAGVLRDVDSLSAIVAAEHIKRVNGEDAIDTESLAEDVTAIANVLHIVDRVVVHVVVKPEVVMTPNDTTSRKDGVIYADMIDIEDRMFIFNFAVGGTRSVEQFRAQSKPPVGSVEPVEDNAGEAE